MRKLQQALIAVAFLLVVACGANAQTALVQTTVATAVSISASQTVFALGSVTGITTSGPLGNRYSLYIDRELMTVIAVNTTSKQVTVVRGAGGTQASAHATATMVLYGPSQAFAAYDPEGYCVTANTLYTPWVNAKTGAQWLCSTVTKTWVPGFGGPRSTPYAVTLLVASAASAVLPSGPLFHINGTAAITGFTIPVGCNATAAGGCQFSVIPDAAFTYTTAGNIAVAGTAVAELMITFTWDATDSKWNVNQSK